MQKSYAIIFTALTSPLWCCWLYVSKSIWQSPIFFNRQLFACACVTKQYNLVPANGWWCLAAGKVTVGLASHWPRVTDISGSPPTGSRSRRGRWAPAYALLWSMVDFTFTFSYLCNHLSCSKHGKLPKRWIFAFDFNLEVSLVLENSMKNVDDESNIRRKCQTDCVRSSSGCR